MPDATPKPAVGAFDAIIGSWFSAATEGLYGHGDLSLDISTDGGRLDKLFSEGDNPYCVSGTTKTFSLENDRLYC